MFLFYKEKQGSLEITQTYGHKYTTDSVSRVGFGGQCVRQESIRLQRQTTSSIQALPLTTYGKSRKKALPHQQGFKSPCHLAAIVLGLGIVRATVLPSRGLCSCQVSCM